MLKVSFQGALGANSDAAARLHFPDQSIETVPCERFVDAFELVANGSVDRAMIPIENSTAGIVYRPYDLLQEYDLHIVGERYHHVEHCLIGQPGAKMADITAAKSHYQALAQCRQYLGSRNIDMVEAFDTAGAVEEIANDPAKDPTVAAIAPELAAEIYGMQLLQVGINDSAHNYTRFIELAREPHPVPIETPAKTSIVFSFEENKPGNLFWVMGAFASREIDLSKLESRPKPGKPFQYMFYVDLIGNAADQRCINSLNQVREMASDLRVLGTYARGEFQASA